MPDDTSLLIDLGGQGCLALVVDDHGQTVFQARRDLCTREDGACIEQDPEAVITATQSLVDEAVTAMTAARRPIVRAALAVQRGSVVCWDRPTGAALSPVLSWRDRRTLAGPDHLAAHAEAIRQRTGLRFSPYAGAPKIAWCVTELPAVRSARDRGRLVCGPLGSFVLARLLDGGPALVDRTLAQRTLLWSHRHSDWDPWLLDRFGLTPDILPTLVASRTAYGLLRSGEQRIPLQLLSGDQNCLPFLHGQPDSSTLYINLGTGAFLLRPLLFPVDDERFQCSLLDEGNGGFWALEASVHGAASALNWLAHEHDVRIPHERWDELRQGIQTPPLFLNCIDGLGSPWWKAGAGSAFVHARERGGDPPEALLLAVLESIAFLIRANAEAMAERIGPPQRVVVCGGLSRSDSLCKLIADVLHSDLQRLRAVEGTALGLWCRLQDQALDSAHFEPIGCKASAALEQRYRQWLPKIEQC